jgi:hypothetical protein
MRPVRLLVAALLAALAFPGAAGAADWLPSSAPLPPGSPGVDTSTGSYPGPFMTTIDERGVTTLVYSWFVFGNSGERDTGLFYTQRRPGQAGFGQPKHVPGTTWQAQLADVQRDAAGNITILYREVPDILVRPLYVVTLKTDGTWTDPVNIYPANAFPGTARLAVGGNGAAAVLSERVIGVPSGNNRAVVQITRRQTASGGWSAPEDLSDTGWNATQAAHAVGPAGESFVVWKEDETDGSGLQRTQFRTAAAGQAYNAAQPVPTPPSPPDGWWFNSFRPGIDEGGTVRLNYSFGGKRYVANGPSFTNPVELYDSGGDEPSMAMTPNGDWTAVTWRTDEDGVAAYEATLRAGASAATLTRLSGPNVRNADVARVASGPEGHLMAMWGESDLDGYVRLHSKTRAPGETGFGTERTATPAEKVAISDSIVLDHEGNAAMLLSEDGVPRFQGYDAAAPFLGREPVAAPAAQDALQFGVADVWSEVASAQWDFGDGTTGSGKDVEHTYASAGSYTLTVQTADTLGHQRTITRQIQVSGPKAPRIEQPPAITGRVQDTFAVAADNGVWAGDPTSVALQWQRCNADGTGCAPIAGAINSAYDVVTADVGKRLRVQAVATNAQGASQPAFSALSDVVLEAPPANTAAPKIEGGWPVPGKLLTASPGEWTAGVTGFVYRWERCDAQHQNCELASTTNKYPVQQSDIGKTFNVRVIAQSAVGDSKPAFSAFTPPVSEPQAPTNLVLPTITGTARPGQSLSLDSPGSWSHDGNPTTYQWQQCNSAGSGCTDIAGQTSTGYFVSTNDVGKRIRLGVIAENAQGKSAMAYTVPSAMVTEVPQPPANAALPAITGTTVVGQKLDASTGAWTNAPTSYAYEWYRCHAQQTWDCTPVGDTDASYALAAADLGKRMQVTVSATNDAGTGGPAYSELTAVVTDVGQPTPPANTGLPAVTGDPQVGKVLSSTDGAWSGSPTSFARQWLRCAGDGTNCAEIPGATGTQLTLAQADAASTIRLRVTASNAAGASAPATSAPTAVVTGGGGNAAVPEITTPPQVTGTAQVGATLTGTDGTWTGAPTSFARQWLRCAADGSACVEIPGATGPQLALTAADTGATLRLRVIATNGAGASAPAASTPTAVVTVAGGGGGGGPLAPTVVSLPALAGAALDGGTLTTTTGTWANDPATFAITWLRCDATGAGCAPIPGASGASYGLKTADVGMTVRSEVVATNAAGSSEPARSPASAPIGGKPAGGNPTPVDLQTTGKLKLKRSGKKLRLIVPVAATCPATGPACSLALTVKRGAAGPVLVSTVIALAPGQTLKRIVVALKPKAVKRKKKLAVDAAVLGSVGAVQTSQARIAGKVKVPKAKK